jgi:hypothetical protein
MQNIEAAVVNHSKQVFGIIRSHAAARLRSHFMLQLIDQLKDPICISERCAPYLIGFRSRGRHNRLPMLVVERLQVFNVGCQLIDESQYRILVKPA